MLFYERRSILKIVIYRYNVAMNSTLIFCVCVFTYPGRLNDSSRPVYTNGRADLEDDKN